MLSVLLIGQFLVIASTASLNIALPALHSSLHASVSQMQWVVIVYQVAYATLLMTGGRLGDLFGARRMFLIGVAAFTGGSLAASAANSTTLVIAARAFQGVAGALISPQVLALIQVALPAALRPRAFSALGIVGGAAFVLGQVLTGFLIEIDPFGAGWRLAFVPNVLLGALVLLGGMKVLPRGNSISNGRLDWVGVLLGGGGALLLLYPMVQGADAGWSWHLLVLLLLAGLVLYVFARHQHAQTLSSRLPLLDTALFGIDSFRGGMALSVALNSCSLAQFFILVIALQTGFGLDAVHTAMTTSVAPIAVIVSATLASSFQQRCGKLIIVAGSVLNAGAALAVIGAALFAGHATTWSFLPAMILSGVASGLLQPAVMIVALSNVPQSKAGTASGVLQTAQQFAGALGVALYGALFFALVSGASGRQVYGHALIWSMVPVLPTSVLLLLLGIRYGSQDFVSADSDGIPGSNATESS